MKLYGTARREVSDITVCIADGAITALNQVVRVTGYTTADGETIGLVVRARALTIDACRGVLGVFKGTLDGGATAIAGDAVLIQWTGYVAVAGAGSAGDVLYLSDAGILDTAPGTFRRIAGTAIGSAMGLMFCDFNGRQDLRYEDAISIEGTVATPSGRYNVRLNYGLRVSILDLAIAGGASSAVTCDATTYLVTCSGGAGSVTITLPATPVDGTEITVKDANGGAAVNNVVLSGNGKTIDGAASLTMTTAWSSATLRYVRSKWYVVARVG